MSASTKSPGSAGVNWREKYTKTRTLGEGGQAQVFEVTEKATGAKFALKQPIDPLDEEVQARTRREIEVQGSLSHPNVMPLLDHDAEDARWLVMPVASAYLKLAFEEDTSGLGRNIDTLSDAELLDVVVQIASALSATHERGFVHRDVKPSNVLFLDEPNGRWVLADWGTVRRPKGTTTKLRTTARLGTDLFAAPEQWDVGHNADKRADYYSLGRLVAAARSEQQLRPGLTALIEGPWRRFVRITTDPDPDKRPEDQRRLEALIDEVKGVGAEVPLDRARDGLRDLEADPRDESAARAFVEEVHDSSDTEELLLDLLPELPQSAFNTMVDASSDAALDKLLTTWAKQEWGNRDFNRANGMLDAMLRLLTAAVRAKRWGLLEDLADSYIEQCRAWDRYRHADDARRWLARLTHNADAAVARALKRNAAARAWFAKGGWTPPSSAPALRAVFRTP